MYRVSIDQVFGNTHLSIHQLVFDSREVEKNDVFVAQRGVHVDGHLFIDKAISSGATVVVCEVMPVDKKQGVTYVQVSDASVALAIMASNFYNNPSEKLLLVGVTGTNGKTTIASLLYQLFKKAGCKVGLLSTVKIMVDDNVYKATHTTPDSVAINAYLNKMVAQDVKYCFMEVSSHGIHQKRTEGLFFAGGIFTNLSHDHLDYHKTFSEYRNVKKSFFDRLPRSAFALTNIDDKNGSYMLQNTKAKKQNYSLRTIADFKTKILEKRLSGTLFAYQGTEVWTQLIGEFNIYNLTAIIATAELLGLEKLEVLTIVSALKSVDGRFEYVVSKDNVTVIVDYAHTPDALKNVLETINDIRTGNEKVITVIGCGGDRDELKRPKMGHIASQLSNEVVFTSDNPRSENPQSILDAMEVGVSPENLKKTLSVLDRRQAIKTACRLLQPGDILLIAGKGHETYQEINGERTYFSDMEEVKKCFKMLKNN